MQVIAFIKNSGDGCLSTNGLAWYITAREAKILFLTGNVEGFLNHIKMSGIPYGNIDFLTQLKGRIVFMDEVDNIGNGIRVFTEKSKGPEQIILQSRNLILSEGKMQILFSGNKKNATDCIQEKAESISGKKIDYFFYWKESHECIEKNCKTCEKNKLPFGQAISIET